MEVGVGNQRAEAENLTGACLSSVYTVFLYDRTHISKSASAVEADAVSYLDTADSPELHDGTAEGAEWMFDIESESNSLAKQEFACENLLGLLLKRPSKPVCHTNQHTRFPPHSRCARESRILGN